MLSLVQRRIFLFAYIYLLRTLTSYALRAFSYKYSHFPVSEKRKEEHLENEVEPMCSAFNNFGDTSNENVSMTPDIKPVS